MEASIRLTAVLRSVLTEQGPSSLEAEVLARKAALDAFGLPSSSSASSSSEFSWSAFSAPRTTSASSKDISSGKKNFAQFLQHVRDLVGEGVSDDDLRSEARWAYSIFARLESVDGAAKGPATKEARQRLAKRLGATSDKQWQEMQDLAANLHRFRGDDAFVRPSKPSSAASAASAGAGGMKPSSSAVVPSAFADLAAAFGSSPEFGDDSAYFPPSIMPPARLPQLVPPSASAPAGAAGNPARLGRRVDKSARSTSPSPERASAAAATAGVDDPVNADWLVDRCAQYIALHRSVVFDESTLAQAALRALKTKGGDVAVQGALFEVVGSLDEDGDGFEFMGMLLGERSKLLRVSDQELSAAIRRYQGGDSAGPASGGMTGRGFSVRTADQIAAEREKRKADRRDARRGIRHEPAPVESKSDDVALPFGRGGGQFATRRLLPKGAVTTNRTGYKEVVIPPPKPSEEEAKVGATARIPIASLNSFAQSAFKNTKSLNKLQSSLFPAAYESNENLLVCAPTGAGKTNVAMLTVLRELESHLVHGILQKSEFKIVYVAPMKALAQEVQTKFSARLKSLGVSVRELTGDMQLTRREIEQTQMIVTTPEKWDVITRKNGSGGDGALVSLVKLLIIDEVHLLADGRGAVIESIVARTLRLVEASQSVVRIVGLSATLPNYMDVALFLRVNPDSGLFHFGDAHRPVPLEQTFIGVTEKNSMKRLALMNEIAFDLAIGAVKKGKQAMIFVHSRKDTTKTARDFRDLAAAKHFTELLAPFEKNDYFESSNPLSGPHGAALRRDLERSRNHDVKDLVMHGLGIHHAGMLRHDRNLSERLFASGTIKILVCTATLAWGVNLPAHTVVIKGTQVYNAERGGFTDLSMLDVMQIFGRAGRPQFDTSGEGIIITHHDRLDHYLGLLTHQVPIESNFVDALPDHLNAEIVSGTVTNLREAITWLSYTYLFIRMMRNPMAYGIPYEERMADPELEMKRIELISRAANRLDECRMIRFEEHSGNFGVTDLGRVASHFYIQHGTIDLFNRMMTPVMSDTQVLDLICAAQEFDNIRVRDEELSELDTLKRDAHLDCKHAIENKNGKINVLLQAFISRIQVFSFTLISDTHYINQSAGRIARALFEICLHRGWASMADMLLAFCKSIDKRLWFDLSPLRQFPHLNADWLFRLEQTSVTFEQMLEMEAGEIGSLVRVPAAGPRIAEALTNIPLLEIAYVIQPITRGILKVSLTITPCFKWNDRLHGTSEPFWLWVEDNTSERIYHHEYLLLQKKQVRSGEALEMEFTIPVFEPLPPQYWVRAVSDRWIGSETSVAMSFQHLLLPESHPPHTDLLDLQPLPITALKNTAYQSLYPFTHFNPVQTQMFHVAYHTDHNVLLGAPTGSGKTLAAELSVMRLMTRAGRAPAGSLVPGGLAVDASVSRRAKAVYIAPLKALVSERLKDWRKKFSKNFGWRIEELTGDSTPDQAALKRADVLITTPEKWDGISRSWQRRDYVQNVSLVIIDEIHLLGEDRGPILEVIVSRMRYISSQTDSPVRVMGLSTALANATDLADWLGIDRVGLYNFRPSVRPIPMDVHIQGFPGKHYCPRMATMNKPVFHAIQTHSPSKPVLVFVASRRQTRLTALELISLCASDENPRQFLHMDPYEMHILAERVKDQALKHTLEFGIGIHHAGLNERDRSLVEDLFVGGKIQVLVCTSTLAWGVNFPAHLVVVKGTEYFDGKTCRYVDFPVTDVLQMMGRAGRPQFDTQGVAVILVHEPKKNFYRKFLYEPFPVESQLLSCLHDHINAEVASGTIASRQDAVDYLTWTYFFRRLLKNPGYYGLEDLEADTVRAFLHTVIDDTLGALERAGCVELCDEVDLSERRRKSGGASAGAGGGEGDEEDQRPPEVSPTILGRISSYYYLHYTTVGIFHRRLLECFDGDAAGGSPPSVFDFEYAIRLLADAAEFNELPVRHNEDELNEQLSHLVPFPPPQSRLDEPNTKAFLLLQAHFLHLPLPISDYINDTKSVLDQAMRVLNAMMDVAADEGLMHAVLQIANVAQSISQARLPNQSTLLQLPHATDAVISGLENAVLSRDGARSKSTFAEPSVTFKADRGDPLPPRVPVSLPEVMDTPTSVLRTHLSRVRGLPASRQSAVIDAIEKLPKIEVKWSIVGDASGGGMPSLEAESVAELEITLTTINSHTASSKAPTSRFPKPKQFGWWLALGGCDPDDGQPDGELLALKRVTASPHRPSSFKLAFDVPFGSGPSGIVLYLLCDAMAGLDQQYIVPFSLTESSSADE